MSLTSATTAGARHLAAAAVIVLGSGLLAGCGGSDSGSPAPQSGASSTPVTSGAPSSPSSSSTSSPTASSTSVAPATGPAVTFSSLSLSIPEGWKLLYKTQFSVTGSDPVATAGIGTVIVNDQPSLSSDTLDSEAMYAMQSARRDGVKATRAPNVTVDGVEGYVISGSSSTYGVYYVFGTVTADHDVSLLFQYADQTPQSQPTIESVLASISWT